MVYENSRVGVTMTMPEWWDSCAVQMSSINITTLHIYFSGMWLHRNNEIS